MQEYKVPPARLNYWEPRSEDHFDGLPHQDNFYPIPKHWITANAARFYFTTKQILEAAQPDFIDPAPDRRCLLWAVYFLIYKGEIVYVGQTRCPETRLEQHREDGKRFDSVTWFEAPQMFINDIEAYYIWRCNPIYNNKWPASRYFGDAAKKLDEQHGEARNDVEYVTTITPHGAYTRKIAKGKR